MNDYPRGWAIGFVTGSVLFALLWGFFSYEPNQVRCEFCAHMDTRLARDTDSGRYLCYKEGLLIP